jgi:hypothetical protein
MTYNWTEILKNKTDKELYDIHLGKTLLPKTVQQLSKQELISRQFDFNNIDKHKLAWQLTRIVEEENYEKIRDKRASFLYINFRQFLIIIIVFLTASLLIYLINKESNYISNEFLLIGILFISLGSILTNYLYKKEKAYLNRREAKKRQIIHELKKDNLIKNEEPILKDILRYVKTDYEISKTQEKIGLTSVYLILVSLCVIAFCFLKVLWASIISAVIILIILMASFEHFIEKNN